MVRRCGGGKDFRVTQRKSHAQDMFVEAEVEFTFVVCGPEGCHGSGDPHAGAHLYGRFTVQHAENARSFPGEGNRYFCIPGIRGFTPFEV